MVKLNKIYTKSGDKGESSLVSGERVKKTDIRFDAIGDIDELNSYIGLIRTLSATKILDFYEDMHPYSFVDIQNCLFDIGCLLGIKEGSDWKNKVRHIQDKDIENLEAYIDVCNKYLEDLDSFVLSGGTELNAHCHIARSICRRAERTIWKLNEEEPVDDLVLKYINRLSDYLFVYARFCGGKKEYLWDSKRS
jgi:cob(I)alamin adenosyltransferase